MYVSQNLLGCLVSFLGGKSVIRSQGVSSLQDADAGISQHHCIGRLETDAISDRHRIWRGCTWY